MKEVACIKKFILVWKEIALELQIRLRDILKRIKDV
jgi:hypothetical protein